MLRIFFDENTCSALNKIHLYNTVLSTIVAMYYTRSSDPIYLIPESLHPFTNLSPTIPQILETNILLCFYEVNVFVFFFLRFHTYTIPVFSFFHLVYFIYHNVSQSHSCYCTWQDFLFFKAV